MEAHLGQRKKLMFSDRVTITAGRTAELNFTQDLLECIEPELLRCRDGRDAAYKSASASYLDRLSGVSV